MEKNLITLAIGALAGLGAVRLWEMRNHYPGQDRTQEFTALAIGAAASYFIINQNK